ncbi:MAG: ABC transporter ATP-binding protein, partial [Lachnospiraceae bacterium]|nr:ABC transporter ATP-binding protein [Lachnospiraceae bacterium]
MREEKRLYLEKKYASKLNPDTIDLTMAPGKGGPGGRPGGGRGPGGRGMAMGKPKNMKQTIGRLFGYIAHEKWKLFIVFACVILASASNLAGSYMLRPIINGLVGEEASVSFLLKGILAMACIYAVSVLTQYLQQRIMITVSQNAVMKLRNDLFERMQKLPVRFYDNNNHGDIMSRFTNDVDTVGEMLNHTVVQLISGSISLVGTFCLMVYTNIWLTLITVVMIPVMMKAVQLVTSRSRKYYKAQQASLGTLNGYIEETMTGQKVVKVFCHEENAKEEFDYLNQDLRGKQIKAQFFGGIMGPVMGNISQ